MASLQCHKRINKKSWRIASAATLASSGAYGFSVGVRADLATTKQESSLKQTSSNKSSLNAKRININSNDALAITGSDLASKEDMSLNSNNLNINSSQDSLKYKSNTKSLTTGFGFTFYGANSSSLELGTNSLKQSEQSLTNNNSHLYSAKDMNINTANDATIKGANLRADERLNLKVGNNLSLESTRDIKDASSKSKGINLSVSYSGATNAKNFASGDRSLSSVGASISKSNSNTKIKQANLSSITANELNVEVGKNTHLKGSLLAAGEYDKDNTFIDNHNLNLKTNTISYENLSNTSYNKGLSLSIGANYSVGKKDDSKASQSDQGKLGSSYSGLKSINYSNNRNLSYSLSKNLATLGSGNIEIADKDNSDDLTRLNRDTTKLTKDLVNTSISSNVDGSMDLRVLTADGREQIKQELEKVGQGIGKFALKALFGNEVYKNIEIIIENLKRIKEADPQRYNEIVKAINEYNKEQEALKGSFIPAAVLPIAPAVLEFLVEIGAVSVALGGAYGAKKIGDKYISDGIDIITENEIGLEYKNSYIPKPSNDELENDDFLPDLRREKPKTPVSGGGGLRPRWKDKDGNIFEWDSQHGEMEIYDKQGKHQGSYNPKTKEKKPPVKSRKVKK